MNIGKTAIVEDRNLSISGWLFDRNSYSNEDHTSRRSLAERVAAAATGKRRDVLEMLAVC